MAMTKVELLRRLKGWSQEDLAARSKLCRVSVWKAETGQRVSQLTLLKLADALSVDVDEIAADKRRCRLAV